MKILFPYLARAKSANWSRYQQLLSARARAGDEIHFLQPPPRESEETNFRDLSMDLPANFHLEEVPLGERFWNTRFPFDKIVKKGAYSLAANRRVKALCRVDAPDVVLIYNLTQEALLGLPVPVVFDVADDLPAMLRVEGGPLAGKAMELLARRALSRMLARAALVTTPSRVLLPRLGANAVFLPNGIDPGEIAAARSRAEAPFSRFRIGFLGSFEYFIDFELVLGLAAKLPDVEFLLIGGGRRFKDIRSRAESLRLQNVDFTGPLAHVDALTRLASCELSLCPFTRDPVGHGASPLKLFESLALAVPVLATRTGEIVAENPPNILFADTVEESIAAVSEYRSRPKASRRDLSARAAAETLASHSWDKVGAVFFEHCRGLLGSR
jgi:glycosyltransferase involved in cell wall biosynthesis